MCNRPRSATRFSFDFELQGMMICGAFTEIFKPIFAPCCWMYCTFVKRIRYQLLLSGNGKCYSRDLHIAWPLLPAVTLKKKNKRRLNSCPFQFCCCFCLLFVCLSYLCHNMNLVTVLKRVFLPKAARQESKLLGIVVRTTLGQLPPSGDLKQPNTTNILGIFLDT